MKTLQARILGLIGGAALLGMATTSMGAITGTDHDFSGEAWNSSGAICAVCHTPHNTGDNSIAPAWNHATTASSFTPYASSSLDATVGQPTGVSLACLSCHDGSVALDSFGGNTGSEVMTGHALVGTDLNNDHPVSFTYDATLASDDGDLVTPASSEAVDSAGILRLFGGQMECSTCHDPHDDSNGNFLAINNAGSSLCISCHQK